MKNNELDQREKLIDRIEGYYGPMDNIHKLSTNELIIIRASIEHLEEFKKRSIVALRKEIK